MNKIFNKKNIFIMFLLCGALSLFSCSNVSPNAISPQDKLIHTNEVPAEDTELNIQQRELLFSHLGLNIDNYELTSSRNTDDILYQWWYRNIENTSNGVYIVIGNVAENDYNGFAAFGDAISEIDESIDYLLEISTGTVDDEGFMLIGEPTMNYYFVQQGDDIAFITLQ